MTCLNVPTVQISTAVHERELLHAFSRFGELARWQLSRGGAVISFHVPGAAAAAVRALDGAPIGPSRIRVALLQGVPPPPDTAVAPAQSPLDMSVARAISATSTPTASPGGMPTAANGRVSGGAGSRRRRGWDEGGPPPQAGPPPPPAGPLSPAGPPPLGPIPAAQAALPGLPQPPTQPVTSAPAAASAEATSAATWSGRLGRPSVQPCQVCLLLHF